MDSLPIATKAYRRAFRAIWPSVAESEGSMTSPSAEPEKCRVCGHTRKENDAHYGIWHAPASKGMIPHTFIAAHSTPVAPAETLGRPERVGLQSVEVEGVWLRREGDWVVVCIERNRQWVEIIREFCEGQFSHICEPGGIVSKSEKTHD